MSKKNILNLLVEESKSYMGLENIQTLIESGQSLVNVPVQPLYMSLRNLPIEAKAALLPTLSQEQRTALLDIDLWSKDLLNVHDFSQWLYVYANTSDEIKYEFIKSPEFILFLKARFNIWTFDVEDPQYPDHDYYFLTEDNQLLFEYDKDCEYIDQVKDAIKHLYSVEGVENAYTFLFKIIADQIGLMTEDEYRLKKNRLQDYGFMDYFDALELTTSLPTRKHVDNFIKKTISQNRPDPSVEDELKLQRPSYGVISAFESINDELTHQLNKIENSSRLEFLNFNFFKLINANIEVNGGVKLGAIELSKCSKETKTLLELGASYISNYSVKIYNKDFSIFDIFSFTEVFKVGKSLIAIEQKKINSKFTTLKLDETFDIFLGQYLDQFISSSMSKSYQFTDFKQSTIQLNSQSNYLLWLNYVSLLTDLLPFAKAFHSKFQELKDENLVQDHFYLNYDVTDIDFPTLLISSFSNFSLGSSTDQFKIGLTLDEFKTFLEKYQKSGNSPEWKNMIDQFLGHFGFDKITLSPSFLSYLLTDSLDGYANVKDLKDDDFKHIGGPIILKA